MYKLLGMEKLDAVAGKDGFKHFSLVNQLIFLNEEQGYSLTLVLENRSAVGKLELEMKFSRVRELSLRKFGRIPTQVTGFELRDVSSQQLEDVGFEFVDYEDDGIHFFFESAEIQRVERIAG